MPIQWVKPPETYIIHGWNKWIRSLSNTQKSQKQWHTHILLNFTSHINEVFTVRMARDKCAKSLQTKPQTNIMITTSKWRNCAPNITLSILCLHLPKSNGLTFTEESHSFSLPKRVERVCDLGVILLYKGISLHPPLAHRQITQWLYATQYCMTTSSAWGVYHHVSFIWLEWSLIWSIGKLKIYVKFITEQMSSRICFSRRKISENKPWLPQKLKHV